MMWRGEGLNKNALRPLDTTTSTDNNGKLFGSLYFVILCKHTQSAEVSAPVYCPQGDGDYSMFEP